MSAKKYAMKKELKPILMKSPIKLPLTYSSQSPSNRLKFALSKLSPLNMYKATQRSQKVSKSLKNYRNLNKTRAKSYMKKNAFESIFINPMITGSLNTNIRYMKEASEDLEEKNYIETPSDSVKSRVEIKTTAEDINFEYENYLLNNFSPQGLKFYLKKRSFTPINKNAKNESKYLGMNLEFPPTMSSFWKTRKFI